MLKNTRERIPSGQFLWFLCLRGIGPRFSYGPPHLEGIITLFMLNSIVESRVQARSPDCSYCFR